MVDRRVIDEVMLLVDHAMDGWTQKQVLVIGGKNKKEFCGKIGVTGSAPFQTQ